MDLFKCAGWIHANTIAKIGRGENALIRNIVRGRPKKKKPRGSKQ